MNNKKKNNHTNGRKKTNNHRNRSGNSNRDDIILKEMQEAISSGRLQGDSEDDFNIHKSINKNKNNYMNRSNKTKNNINNPSSSVIPTSQSKGKNSTSFRQKKVNSDKNRNTVPSRNNKDNHTKNNESNNKISSSTTNQYPSNGKNNDQKVSKKSRKKKNKIHQDVNQADCHSLKDSKPNVAQDGGKKQKKGKARTKNINYDEYESLSECNRLYAAGDKNLIRGKLRVVPGGNIAFLACDRGLYSRDVVISTEKERNRALNGDIVYVQVIGPVDKDNITIPNNNEEDADCTNEDLEGKDNAKLSDFMQEMTIDDTEMELSGSNNINSNEYEDYDIDESCKTYDEESDEEELEGVTSEGNPYDNIRDEGVKVTRWNDDDVQKSLWNPLVNTRKVDNTGNNIMNDHAEEQFKGRVIHVIPPKGAIQQPSEINPGDIAKVPAKRTIVGSLKKPPGENSNFILLVPNNRSLPRFMTPRSTQFPFDNPQQLYRAEYVYGSWKSNSKWAPCINLQKMGNSCNVEDETEALLVENNVNHGDFSQEVYKVVEDVVQSGRTISDNGELGWEPTPDMFKNRRDYRNERIFTIDPTTARDLDDALHVKQLPDGRVEIGVHIADVSYFVSPGTALDQEAQHRATTVYLVDRVIPMVPRPLCEVACSLNENVERLAFSCVWRMNMDGTVEPNSQHRKKDEVWYGRTVIKSCARLDYATAQNIIDKKVASGEKNVNPALWPESRQPTGGHTIDEVAADVRLMHKVAMARRKLRLENGALTLNGVKLTFQLKSGSETPELCEPYPIRDSNRLVEEYMLLANFLVAQRLITHAGGLALLRNHPPPLNEGLQDVVEIANTSIGFHIDIQSSQSLQRSLNRLGRECNDQLVMQCITEQLMKPMKPAEYVAAGTLEEEAWRHFALNIPYYTHFTSPIRRYADVMVHRLLQETILDQGEDSYVDKFYVDQKEISSIAAQCNEMRMNAKFASERSDRVFLSLYLRANPISSTLGIVLSVGTKAFTCFVPSLGMSTMIYVDDHTDRFDIDVQDESKKKRMLFVPKRDNNSDVESRPVSIGIFTKINVSCYCKEKPPIDVGLLLIGPWQDR